MPDRGLYWFPMEDSQGLFHLEGREGRGNAEGRKTFHKNVPHFMGE